MKFFCERRCSHDVPKGKESLILGGFFNQGSRIIMIDMENKRIKFLNPLLTMTWERQVRSF